MHYLVIRKAIHFFFGIISIAFLYGQPFQEILGQRSHYLLALAAIILLLLDLWRRRPGKWRDLFYHIFNRLLKPSERDGQLSGATTFLLTVSALPFLFPKNVVIVSILVLSISDPLASIAGTLKPLKKIRREKSLTGNAVFFLSSLSIFVFFVPGSIPYLLVAALLTTLVELLAPEVIENIAIGFSAAFIIAPLM